MNSQQHFANKVSTATLFTLPSRAESAMTATFDAAALVNLFYAISTTAS
jgi:hypothetical protein